MWHALGGTLQVSLVWHGHRLKDVQSMWQNIFHATTLLFEQIMHLLLFGFYPLYTPQHNTTPIPEFCGQARHQVLDDIAMQSLW